MKPLPPGITISTQPYEGAITAKLEGAAWHPDNSPRLQGNIMGDAFKRFHNGEFVTTSKVVEQVGHDLFRTGNGSVYIVEWEHEMPQEKPAVVATTEVAPSDVSQQFHFIYREKPEYKEEVWWWYENGPTRYWKRIDSGYITPRMAHEAGWKYGGVAVW